MTTTRQQIAARRKPPKGVASLRVEQRRAVLAELLREHHGITVTPFSPSWEHSPLMRILEEAFEAGRRYPARGAKGRAR